MRFTSAFFAGSLLLAGCVSSPQPSDLEPATETASEVVAEAEESWEGMWTFGETWPGSGEVTNVMDYTLVMGRFEGELEGGVGINGYQTMANYEVRGTPRGDTLDVTVSGYGEDHISRGVELGDRLFSLVPAASGGYTTVWDAITPAIGEEMEGTAFVREETE